MPKGGKIIFWIVIILSSFLTVFLLYTKQKNDSAIWEPIKKEQTQAPISLSKPVILVSDPSVGALDALITIIEFADFRCTHCKDAHAELRNLLSQYPKKLRIVWKDFPSTPPKEESQKAHRAARCAQLQGKFWEYADELFSHQENLSDEIYNSLAQTLQLNTENFQSCFSQNTTTSLVDRSYAEGQSLNVDGTPTLYVNGERWSEDIQSIANLIK